MHIASFKIENYKSFLASGEIHLTKGFNVIVGQNNVGKTALIEALSLGFAINPHRSLKTAQDLNAAFQSYSNSVLVFELGKDELLELLLACGIYSFYLPSTKTKQSDVRLNHPLDELSDSFRISCIFRESKIIVTPNFVTQKETKSLQFHFTGPNRQLTLSSGNLFELDSTHDLAKRLANILKERIYMFKAERFIEDQSSVGTNSILAPNARNLAQVLNHLQNSNTNRFKRFNKYVSTIFPEIKQITAPLLENTTNAGISIWTIDPESEQVNLAIPLSQSGTGIGQVLAILYVVLTLDFPGVIIIDEPQSFLHPGAVRKLFDILKHDFPQHQYIITTHSPVAVTAADPQQIFLIRKQEAESSIETVDMAETHKLRLFLVEIGARLSDVFGADDILWVEGGTEELCFPLILSKIANQPLLGTAIIGVKQTGDFEGKHSKTVFEIYERLSTGRGLLPPALGFIFDHEGRSEKEITDLKRMSNETIFFLPRRMYENYLLNAGAIASVMSNISGFRESQLTAEEISGWIEEHRWQERYFDEKIRKEDRSEELWITRVHGAKILEDLFKTLSANRVDFDKVKHGSALTNWIIQNAPKELMEVSKLIQLALSRDKNS